MRHVIPILASLFACTLVLGSTITVTPMGSLPKTVKSFANDLYAQVTAEKRLIQLFLDEGKAKRKLSDEERAYEEANGIHLRRKENGMLVIVHPHGCNGVFTDENDLVYFWYLHSPRTLSITSEKYESTALVLDEPRLDWIHGMEEEANQPPQTTPASAPR